MVGRLHHKCQKISLWLDLDRIEYIEHIFMLDHLHLHGELLGLFLVVQNRQVDNDDEFEPLAGLIQLVRGEPDADEAVKALAVQRIILSRLGCHEIG